MRLLNLLAMILASGLAAAANRALVSIDSKAARPLKPAIFSTATIYDNGGLRPEDPRMADLLRAIRPAVLRLPAGNTVNYWDWNAGAPCTPEQLLRFGADPSYSLARRPVGDRAGYLKNMGGPMIAERWAKLAALGGGEPLWTLNVSTVGPEETRKFLLHLKTAGLPAHRFELGNELYHSNHWGREVPTVEDYIAKAKAHAREVKAIFPNAEVAVCVNANDDRVNGPLVKAAPGKFKPAPLSKWNAALSKESFYDAVVIHLYFKSEELKDLARVTADDYARWAIVRGSAFSAGEILAWPGRVFPGKKVWATEWNLNNRLYKISHPQQNYRFLPEHTVLSGLFTAHFLLNAASVPSNLEIANYWQLNSGPDFGLMAGDPPAYRPAYHVLRMLAPAARECDRIAALEIPGAPEVRGPLEFSVMKAAAVTGYAFIDKTGVRHLAFLNFTGASFPLRVRGLGAHGGKAAMETLSGETLLPAWNNPANPPPDKWAPPYRVARSETDVDSIDLAPYSFSLVTLPPPAARVDVDAAAARPLRRAIFSTATTYNLSGAPPEDPVVLRVLRTVRPPVLRMPAGNTMNLWDWNAGTVRTADQLTKFGADPNFRLAEGPVKGRRQYIQDMGGPMAAERWVKLAREGGSEPLWGLNVSTMSAEENRKFLLHLKSAGLPAAMFELGNELYLSQLWGREIDSVQKYIRNAKAVAREVKSVFPQAKVAVCIQVSFVKAMLETGGNPAQNEWNAALARESFYDAVVVHSYTFSQELGTLKDMPAGDYARWAIVRGSADFVRTGLAVPGRVFPGKEIWLTEWNLNNRIYKRDHPEVGNRYLPEHTLFSGLFTAAYVLNAAAVPSNLTIANYWHFYGGPDFGLISGDPPKERPAFHVFRMLSPAVHECDAIAALALPDAPRARGPKQFAAVEAPAIAAFAFFRAARPRYLALVNFTERDAVYDIRFPQKPAAGGQAEYLTGPELLPSWNNPANPAPSAWDPKYELRRSGVRLDVLSVPARSFAVVKLPDE